MAAGTLEGYLPTLPRPSHVSDAAGGRRGYPRPSSKPKVQPTGRAPYPVSESEIGSRLWKLGLWHLADAVGKCGRSYAKLGCRAGDEAYYRAIVCRFPLCERCRTEDSEAESRKTAKALEKFDRVAGVWKLVLTLPQSVRDAIFVMAADPIQDRLVKKVFNKLRRIAADFGMEVFGVEGIEVVLHPIGDRGGFNPHFEVLAPFFVGEWADPTSCPGVREWIGSLSRRWSDALRRLDVELEIPAGVQVHASFADKPGRIVHKVTYAVDHHWARKPDYIKRKALRFCAALRGHRMSRGYGLLDDKRWRTYVEAKPYAHADMEDDGRERARAEKLTLADGCPVHGCRLRFAGVHDERDIHKSELREISKGVWVDRVHALLIRAALDGGGRDRPPAVKER